MFRDQIKKELYGYPERRKGRLDELKKFIKKDDQLQNITFIEDPKVGSRKIIRIIEKHPDIFKDLKGSDIVLFETVEKNVPLGFTKSKERIIGIDRRILNTEITGIDPLTRSRKLFSPKNVLKHEVAHLKSGKILENLGLNETGAYDPVRENALAELASEYASHVDIRKEKLPKELTDRIGFKFLSKVIQ